MSRGLIILNPVAGGGAVADEIEAWQERRPDMELRRTTGGGDAQRWAREVAEEGCGLVVAAGGDGTLHEVASGILEAGVGSRTALGIIPLGTGNDLARSLEIPDDVEEALELLDRGHRKAMDVARVELDGEARFLVNALTGGFSGEIHDALDRELKASWGPLSYLRSGLETWGERTGYHLEVEVDGETVRHEEALNLVVANGAFAGHGIPVAPGADPWDGTLDVLVVREAPTLELSALAASMLTGEPVEHEALWRRRGIEVGIRAREAFPVSVDGEPSTAESLAFTLLPGRLPVLVGPRGSV